MRNTIGDKIRGRWDLIFNQSPKFRRYKIGGEYYIQRPLVLGQIQQLLDLLKGVAVPADAGVFELITILGDRVSAALAIVLVGEGESPEEKDLETLAGRIKFAVTPEMAMEIIEDFLVCNPVSSILERLTGMAKEIRVMMLPPTGLQSSVSSSVTETSPNEIALSGE